jgi:hypothetical protein
MGHKET